MTKPAEMTRLQALGLLGWLLLGFVSFGLGAFLFLLMEGNVRLWWYADRYLAAELEVRQVRQVDSGRREGAMRIEGVIHPGGETVVVGGYAVFGYQDGRPYGLPTPAEIEGQRVPVLYWPNHVGDAGWWHPPRIVRPGATQREGVVAGAVLSWIGLGGLAAYCFRRVYRRAAGS
jgi:hypothetical protein